jgi:cell division protein FtsL
MADTTLRAIPRINVFPLSRPRLLPLLIFMAVLMTISLFFVWSRLQVVNLEYDLSRLESRVRDLQQEGRKLRLEAASLRHPGRIEQVARNQLGLRLPVPEQVIAFD